MIENWDGGNMVATMNVEDKDTSSYGIISPGKLFKIKLKSVALLKNPNQKMLPQI